MLARLTASTSSLTGAAPPPAGLVPAPEAATGATRRSPAGVVVATGGATDHRRLAVGPLIPGPAPTLVATGASPAVAARPIAEKATGATESPRHATTRFGIIQTAARHHPIGPHDAEMADPAPDPTVAHHGVRGETGGEKGEQNIGCPGLHPKQIEAPHCLHRDLQV